MEKIISAFCQHPDRKGLFDYVSERTPITFEPSNSLMWGSQTVDGETTIFWAESRHPEACLCHELLHAKLKIDGYKQYVIAVCRTDKESSIANVLGALDNELPHHAFYREFEALGFSPSEMYNDDDTETYQYIKLEIDKLQGADSPMESYFYILISIIAPSGCFDDAQRAELLDLLEQKAPRRFQRRLNTIRESFTSFAASGNPDAGTTIVSILKALDGYEPTWISYQRDVFPDKGQFVGDAFTEDDVLSGRG
jgi:hypothetical protein